MDVKGPLLGLGFLALLAGEAVATPSCPDIAVRENLATEVRGWRAVFSEPSRRLNRISFHDRHPSERVALVPEATTKARGRETATWRFGKDSGRRIWMECGYAGTSISMIRELPAGTKTCSVVYETNVRVAGMPRIENMECR